VLRDNDQLILVDDFVGTGDTVKNVLAEIPGGAGKVSPQLSIAAMVCHSLGAAALHRIGVSVFRAMDISEGIRSNPRFDGEKKAAYNALMRAVEARLAISPMFEFGFKRSEALVSFQTVPNNTFPVYWATKKKDRTTRQAPFVRPSQ